MGGGRKFMYPMNMSDVEYPDITKHSGTRKDKRNLVEEWKNTMKDEVIFLFVLLLFSHFPDYIYIFSCLK